MAGLHGPVEALKGKSFIDVTSQAAGWRAEKCKMRAAGAKAWHAHCKRSLSACNAVPPSRLISTLCLWWTKA
jgi:hypothetical protein